MVMPIVNIQKFLGLDNIHDPSVLQPTEHGALLSQATNVDIDDSGGLRLRPGMDQKLSGAYHSLWSDGKIFLAVKADSLYLLQYASPTLTATAILSGLSYGSKMVYEKTAPDIIVFTNGSHIGYLQENHVHDFPDLPGDRSYVQHMPAGHLLDWYNGRLYVARGNGIHFSEVMEPWYNDSRTSIRQLRCFITLMRCVRGGMYLSDGEVTFFATGTSPYSLKLDVVAEYPAYPFTDVITDTSMIGKMRQGEEKERIILWRSPQGICMGGPAGDFRNLTGERWNDQGAEHMLFGAAILYKADDFNHYVSIVGT